MRTYKHAIVLVVISMSAACAKKGEEAAVQTTPPATTAPTQFTITGVTGATNPPVQQNNGQPQQVSTDSNADAWLVQSTVPTIVWSESTGEQSYELAIMEADNNTVRCPPVQVPADVHQFTVTNCQLQDNQTYRIRLVAKNNIGVTAASNNAFSFQVDVAGVNAPNNPGIVQSSGFDNQGSASATKVRDYSLYIADLSLVGTWARKLEGGQWVEVKGERITPISGAIPMSFPGVPFPTAARHSFETKLTFDSDGSLNFIGRLDGVTFVAKNIQYEYVPTDDYEAETGETFESEDSDNLIISNFIAQSLSDSRKKLEVSEIKASEDTEQAIVGKRRQIKRDKTKDKKDKKDKKNNGSRTEDADKSESEEAQDKAKAEEKETKAKDDSKEKPAERGVRLKNVGFFITESVHFNVPAVKIIDLPTPPPQQQGPQGQQQQQLPIRSVQAPAPELQQSLSLQARDPVLLP